MKAKTLSICLLCLGISAFGEVRVDLNGVIGKDFMSSPSFDQAVQALGNDNPFTGFGWEVVIKHIGIGAQYLVDFHNDGSDSWWVDWDGQAAYLSYHFFRALSVVDPFVDAGVGCAGRVFIGPGSMPSDCDATRLAISVYPFVSAGASLYLHGLRVGAKLSYDLGRTAIPATTISDYPIGRFQVSATAGFSMGFGRSR
jgi:hypothetical protein